MTDAYAYELPRSPIGDVLDSLRFFLQAQHDPRAHEAATSAVAEALGVPPDQLEGVCRALMVAPDPDDAEDPARARVAQREALAAAAGRAALIAVVGSIGGLLGILALLKLGIGGGSYP